MAEPTNQLTAAQAIDIVESVINNPNLRFLNRAEHIVVSQAVERIRAFAVAGENAIAKQLQDTCKDEKAV